MFSLNPVDIFVVLGALTSAAVAVASMPSSSHREKPVLSMGADDSVKASDAINDEETGKNLEQEKLGPHLGDDDHMRERTSSLESTSTESMRSISYSSRGPSDLIFVDGSDVSDETGSNSDDSSEYSEDSEEWLSIKPKQRLRLVPDDNRSKPGFRGGNQSTLIV